jgi:hypothetical protein
MLDHVGGYVCLSFRLATGVSHHVADKE